MSEVKYQALRRPELSWIENVQFTEMYQFNEMVLTLIYFLTWFCEVHECYCSISDSLPFSVHYVICSIMYYTRTQGTWDLLHSHPLKDKLTYLLEKILNKII